MEIITHIKDSDIVSSWDIKAKIVETKDGLFALIVPSLYKNKYKDKKNKTTTPRSTKGASPASTRKSRTNAQRTYPVMGYDVRSKIKVNIELVMNDGVDSFTCNGEDIKLSKKKKPKVSKMPTVIIKDPYFEFKRRKAKLKTKPPVEDHYNVFIDMLGAKKRFVKGSNNIEDVLPKDEFLKLWRKAKAKYHPDFYPFASQVEDEQILEMSQCVNNFEELYVAIKRFLEWKRGPLRYWKPKPYPDWWFP